MVDVELEENVAGWKRHVSDLGWIPCGYDKAARRGIVFDLIDDDRQLIDAISVCAARRRATAPPV